MITMRFDAGWTGKALACWGIAAGVSLAVATASRSADAAEAHPFSALTGAWTGNGTVMRSNGGTERIRCRANYDTKGTNQLQLRLRCASDSYNFDLSSNVVYDRGNFTGTWAEATRSANGTIQGQSSNNGRQVQAVAKGIVFTANLTVNTRGNSQAITIMSPGSEFSEVDIMLDKQ